MKMRDTWEQCRCVTDMITNNGYQLKLPGWGVGLVTHASALKSCGGFTVGQVAPTYDKARQRPVKRAIVAILYL